MFPESESQLVVDGPLGVEQKAVIDDEVEVFYKGVYILVLVCQHLFGELVGILLNKFICYESMVR